MIVTRGPGARPVRPVVGVDELRRAWLALQQGQFRGTGEVRSDEHAFPSSWSPGPGEVVLPVMGCAAAVGTTTLALALGETSRLPARVVECCSAATSGLAAASTAELGNHPAGWLQGTRADLLLERIDGLLTRAVEVPHPLPWAASGVTVLDVGWDSAHVFAESSWLSRTIRSAELTVLVVAATVPGFRRLETALEHFPDLSRLVVAVVGPRRKKWPRCLEHSAGPRTRRLLAAPGRVVAVPVDPDRAVTGLDERPLPQALLAAAEQIHTHLPTPTTPTNRTPVQDDPRTAPEGTHPHE